MLQQGKKTPEVELYHCIINLSRVSPETLQVLPVIYKTCAQTSAS